MVMIFQHECSSGDVCIDETRQYNGQYVRIARRLVDKQEVDEADMGLMYRVQLANGDYFNAFDDELTPPA